MAGSQTSIFSRSDASGCFTIDEVEVDVTTEEEPLRGVQRLRIGYVLALVLIGAFTLLGQVVIQDALRSQLHSAEVINLAGRQRMLSQRVAKRGLLLTQASSEAEFIDLRSKLEQDLETWERTHARLLHGDLATSGTGATMLADLDETQTALARSTQRLTMLDWEQRDRVGPVVTEILGLEQVYLPRMNDIVFELSRTTEASVAQTRTTEYGLAGGTLLLLVAEALLIFGPLLRRVRASVAAREALATRLARSEARFARAVEGTNEGLWDWNLDTGELHWSRRFCEIIGLDPEPSPRWRDFERRIVRADRERLSALLGPRETLPDTVDLEFRLDRPEGPFWVKLEGATTHGAYLSGSLTEIDAQRRVEAERERLLRNREAALQDTREDLMRTQLMNAVGALAGGIAHDFNNYLLVIQLSAQLLQDENERNAELVGPLLQATEDAASLAQQLLALRRSGGDELLVPVSLEDAMKTFEPMLRRLLPASVALTIDLDPGLPRVLADAGQLRQVLVNLCLNARDAMPKGGHLKLRARAQTSRRSADGPREGVELSVEDDGVGMDADVHNRAFEPFFTTKNMGKGTGLGLAMVEAIVRRHDGWVAIESAVDSGTMVRLWLPSTDEGTHADERQTAAVAVRQLSVLLVDDEPQILELATRVLERVGHSVVAVGDGEAAIAAAQDPANAFDVVLCDVVLPGLHGPEVADRLRLELGWDIPVLLMSGYSESRVDVSGPRIDFIRKPFGADAIRKRLWTLVGSASEGRAEGQQDSGSLRR